jgi:hypothetical protein
MKMFRKKYKSAYNIKRQSNSLYKLIIIGNFHGYLLVFPWAPGVIYHLSEINNYGKM